jgi:hypothetical protein
MNVRYLRLILPLALLVAVLPAFAASAAETKLVAAGATWRYHDKGTDLGTAWRAAGYDDSGWRSGHAQMGFGDGDEVTKLTSGRPTYYFRSSFTVADKSAISSLLVKVVADDGAVVYLNGSEVYRTSNMPSGQSYKTLAKTTIAGSAEAAWNSGTVPASALVNGTNVLAVEVHQASLSSSDVSFDFQLRATTGSSGSGSTPATSATTQMCKITDSRVNELSGLAASVRFPGILWANNDSGDTNRVYAIDSSTCQVKAVVKMSGAGYYDYESIAMGRDGSGNPEIWVGDTGDNSRSRANVQLYRFSEPTSLKDQTVTVKKVTVTWSDGKRDSESMFVEPVPNGRVFLVSKEANSGVYELRGDYRSTGWATTGSRISSTIGTATDAAVAPNGSRTVIRNYTKSTSLLSGIPGTSAKTLAIPSQQQGEAITFSSDSRYVFVGSEGSGQPLYRVPVS